MHKFFSKVSVGALNISQYESSYNLTRPISRVLTDRHLIFYSPPTTSPTCCYSARKCTPVHFQQVFSIDKVILNSNFNLGISFLTSIVGIFYFKLCGLLSSLVLRNIIHFLFWFRRKTSVFAGTSMNSRCLITGSRQRGGLQEEDGFVVFNVAYLVCSSCFKQRLLHHRGWTVRYASFVILVVLCMNDKISINALRGQFFNGLLKCSQSLPLNVARALPGSSLPIS